MTFENWNGNLYVWVLLTLCIYFDYINIILLKIKQSICEQLFPKKLTTCLGTIQIGIIIIIPVNCLVEKYWHAYRLWEKSELINRQYFPWK